MKTLVGSNTGPKNKKDHTNTLKLDIIITGAKI